MKGEWCYYKSYFSKEYCDSIIERSNILEFNQATLGEDGSNKNYKHRMSEVKWILEKDFPDLYDTMWKLQRQSNLEWFGFHVDNLEYIQLAKYDSKYKGEYKRHNDIFWVNQNDRHRKITAVIQLSDPSSYTGGSFELLDCGIYPDENEIKQQGTVIFFPSFMYHQVTPVLSGTRYSLAVWFEGPKWR